jgi:hypothetical protein
MLFPAHPRTQKGFGPLVLVGELAAMDNLRYIASRWLHGISLPDGQRAGGAYGFGGHSARSHCFGSPLTDLRPAPRIGQHWSVLNHRQPNAR